MNKNLLFIAPSNSIHSKKWIESFTNKELNIYWLSFYKKNSECKNIHTSIKYFEILDNNFFKVYFKLKKIINDNNISVLHLHYIGRMSFIILFFRLKKIIVTPWGSDLKLVNPKTLKGFFIKKILNISNLITVDAMFMKEHIKRFTKKELNIHLITFGTDTEVFKKMKTYDSEYIKIISLRKLEKIYAIDTLIEAISSINSKYKDLKILLDIYGSGSQKFYLKNLVKDLSLNKLIKFKGSYLYNDLPEILSQYNLYISTSSSDAGLAGSTSEAMSCELFIITADNSDNKFWMDNNCGLLFKTNSSDDLCSKIVKFSEMSKEEKIKYGKNARNKIIKKNSIRSQMTKMYKFYVNS